jgi:hypothetical protein
MGVLARLRDRVGGSRARFGRELRAAYLDARRVATQLRRHGTRVPYPALSQDFRRLAEAADGHVALLADEIRAVAGNTDPADPIAPREGRNHWERLTVDLADLETLQRRYTELALHWDVEHPASAVTFDRLARATAAMSRDVRTMLARSDPHAAHSDA